MEERLEGNDLILRCREVWDTATEAADDELVRALTEVGRQVRCYAFKNRTKSSNAIAKKVRRKRGEGDRLRREAEAQAANGLPTRDGQRPSPEALNRAIESALNYGPDHVTDVWGCRYVTLYQSEIPPTVEALLKKLEDFNRGRSNGNVRMREFVVYTNRPPHDPLSIAEATLGIVTRSGFAQSVVGSDSLIREPESRKSAYSSVHFVFERDVEMEHPGKDKVEETASFEIQVRDIFEEGWGEVQHALLYSGKDDLDEDETQEDPNAEIWRLHLNALKTFVDGCSQHASIIRRNLESLRRPAIATSESQSATKRTEDRAGILRVLKARGARRETERAVSSAYTILLAAESTSDPEAAALYYSNSAEALATALDLLGERADLPMEPPSRRNVRYFLEIEMANCLFLMAEAQTNNEPNPTDERLTTRRRLLGEAVAIYERVAAANEDDPTVRLRLGKAIQRLGSDPGALDRASTLLDECLARIENDAATGLDHWLPISAHIQKGTVLWAKAKAFPIGAAERRDLIEQAVSVTMEACRIWKRQSTEARQSKENYVGCHKAASNVLYYVAQLVRKDQGSDRFGPETLKEHLSLLDEMSVEPYKEYYKTRDNLMQAYDALGDSTIARGLATENFSELRALAEGRAGRPLDIQQVQGQLAGQELGCYDAARDLLLRDICG